MDIQQSIPPDAYDREYFLSQICKGFEEALAGERGETALAIAKRGAFGEVPAFGCQERGEDGVAKRPGRIERIFTIHEYSGHLWR